MSTKEILKELPKLSQKDRRAIIRRLMKWEVQSRAKGNVPRQKIRDGELGMVTRNPSFAFLREEADLYE